jgi:uncharacterized protein (TIGR02145 family)
MKMKAILTLTAFIIVVVVFGQKVTINLSFNAINNLTQIQLDEIEIMNKTQGVDTIIYYPDTSISYMITPGDMLLLIGYSMGYPVAIQKIKQENNPFELFGNCSNPFIDHYNFSVIVPESGIVNLQVTDIQGRNLFDDNWQLDKGSHSFRCIPGDGKIFFLMARWKGKSKTIKILSAGSSSGGKCLIEYTGGGVKRPSLKASLFTSDRDMQESGILDSPTTSKTYTFQFATNIPCPGTPTIIYDGQVYNTIQIYSQCWLKENLNAGIKINGNQEQGNNGIFEKYCINNKDDSCSKYGGLYQWDEMMNYVEVEGAKGICPPDWHIPSDLEWQILEGVADSQYGITDSIWTSNWLYRGFDQALNLKSISGWEENGNGLDLFGFGALASGHRFLNGTFCVTGIYGTFWSSTKTGVNYAIRRRFASYTDNINREGDPWQWGFSVRCIKD